MSLMSSSILGDGPCQYILGCVVHFLNYNIFPREKKKKQTQDNSWLKGGYRKVVFLSNKLGQSLNKSSPSAWINIYSFQTNIRFMCLPKTLFCSGFH